MKAFFSGLVYNATKSKTAGGAILMSALWAGWNGWAAPKIGGVVLGEEILMTAIGAIGLKEAVGKVKETPVVE